MSPSSIDSRPGRKKLGNRDTEAALDYHEATKHSQRSVHWSCFARGAALGRRP